MSEQGFGFGCILLESLDTWAFSWIVPGAQSSSFTTLVGGAWVKVCLGRAGSSQLQDHKVRCWSAWAVLYPAVGTSTSFVSAVQAHLREASSCSSRSSDYFIPNQRGTDLRKELRDLSRMCKNCVYFLYTFYWTGLHLSHTSHCHHGHGPLNPWDVRLQTVL